MTLDPKDIRIGSWLMDPDGEPFEVLGISKSRGNSEYFVEWREDYWLKKCCPIPLTEEVLKACSWDELETSLKIHFGVMVLDLSALGHYRIYYADCESLHLFQNAYRVRTGKELPINPAALRETVKNLSK